MIPWLEFEGHLGIVETVKRVRRAFLRKSHATYFTRRYKLVIDLVRSDNQRAFGAFIGCSNYPECRYTRRPGVTPQRR